MVFCVAMLHTDVLIALLAVECADCIQLLLAPSNRAAWLVVDALVVGCITAISAMGIECCIRILARCQTDCFGTDWAYNDVCLLPSSCGTSMACVRAVVKAEDIAATVTLEG